MIRLLPKIAVPTALKLSLCLGLTLAAAVRATAQDVRDLEDARRGDAEAQYRVGWFYYTHLRYNEAEPWLKKSAEQGNLQGQYAYGKVLPWEAGTPWMRKAAERGHVEAQKEMAVRMKEKNPAESRAWYEKAAAQGDAGAEFAIGSIYAFGDGVPHDPAQAFVWYEKAARHGLDSGMFMVALALERGDGVAADPDRAFDFYLSAAAKGHRIATQKLEQMIAAGKRPEQHGRIYVTLGRAAEAASNRLTALKYYKKGAALGSADCQWLAGTLTLDLIGEAEAVKFWTAAAAQGHAEAQSELRKRGVKW